MPCPAPSACRAAGPLQDATSPAFKGGLAVKLPRSPASAESATICKRPALLPAISSRINREIQAAPFLTSRGLHGICNDLQAGPHHSRPGGRPVTRFHPPLFRAAVRLLFGLLFSPRRLILLRCKMRCAPFSLTISIA